MGRIFPAKDTKVSIVTGASGGLGLSMAEALAGAGSNVALVGRQMELLNQAAESIGRQTGRYTLAVQADVGVFEQIALAVDRVVTEFGRINVLVNNAAINIRHPALDYSPEEWEQVLNVNLKGAFFVAQACGKQMIQQKQGKIINILSSTLYMI